jgi:hypothetical protein
MATHRTLQATAVALLAAAACQVKQAPRLVVAAEDGSKFFESCDAGSCETEGRDSEGRLLSRESSAPDGSRSTWVYDPPGVLERFEQLRALQKRPHRRTWIQTVWIGKLGGMDRRETFIWDETAPTVEVLVEEGSFGANSWAVVKREQRLRDVQ